MTQSIAMPDRARLGIVMMLAAWFCFALVDSSAKWLVTAGLPALQLAFMRYAGHFAISLGIAATNGQSLSRFRTPHLGPLLVRAALLLSATVMNFWVLSVLPLTVTSAIMFSSPILVSLLAWPLLGERVGPWRMGAILVGFAGVLVVIRPFGESFHWMMLLVPYNALAMALYSILTRKLAGSVSTEVMQFIMGATGTVALLPFALWVWQSPDSARDWLLLAALGVFGWGGHQLLTGAHRFGSASTLMPYTYSFLIYLTAISWLVFDHVPDLWTMVGAAIIVGSGLVIWKREQS
jgi:drug/metabolite transporter (DMT)-like permease